MEFSIEELEAVQLAIDARIEEAKLHLNKLEGDSEDKPAAEKSLKNLLNVRDKLSSSEPKGAPGVEGAHSDEASGLKQNFTNHHILLVDDNESIRKHMILILKKHGFNRFDEAENGYVAIEKIKSKTIPYDLILCDMNMPVLSGMDVLRVIREEGSCAKIPFIMVTSENNKEILLKAIKAGVSDFVAKPVDEDMLLKKIGILLQ